MAQKVAFSHLLDELVVVLLCDVPLRITPCHACRQRAQVWCMAHAVSESSSSSSGGSGSSSGSSSSGSGSGSSQQQ
jgi:uncharacterized membrane protein YgcG